MRKQETNPCCHKLLPIFLQLLLHRRTSPSLFLFSLLCQAPQSLSGVHASLGCLLISTQAGSALSNRDIKTSLLTPSPPPGICLFLLLSLIFWKVVHPGCSTSLPHRSALKSEDCLCRLLKPPTLDCFLSATLDCGPLSPRPALSPQSCDASWTLPPRLLPGP